MRRKNIIWASFIPLLFASVLILGVSTATTATIYVDPSTATVGPEESITINIKITDAEDLWAIGFKVGYDTGLLRLDDVEYGGFLGPLTYPDQFTYTIDMIQGYVDVGCALLYGDPGASGSGTLAMLTFVALPVYAGSGDNDIDLFDVTLIDSDQNEITDKVVLDGEVEVLYPVLWFHKYGASRAIWVEEPRLPVDTPETLYAKITNTGTSGAYVRVRFEVVDITGTPVEDGEVLSNEVWIDAATIDPETGEDIFPKAIVSGEFTPTMQGTYFVKGIIEWSMVDSWVSPPLGGIAEARDIQTTRFTAS